MEKTYQVRRLNAVKHGILSKEAVLPHESKDEFEDLLAQYEKELAPAVILIPGKEGSLGIGMEKITETVERAVGADILA